MIRLTNGDLFFDTPLYILQEKKIISGIKTRFLQQ